MFLTRRLITAPIFGSRAWCRPLPRACRTRPQPRRGYNYARRRRFFNTKLGTHTALKGRRAAQPDLLLAEEDFLTSGQKGFPFIEVTDSDLVTSSESPTPHPCAFH